DLTAMHPQQQVGFVEPVPRAVGVGSGERLVDGADAASGPFGLGHGAERAGLDVFPGPFQPDPALDRLRDAGGVLQRAAYHPRVQRLRYSARRAATHMIRLFMIRQVTDPGPNKPWSSRPGSSGRVHV